MKRTDLEKNIGLKIASRLKQAGTPERFGKASGLPEGHDQKVNKLLGGLLKKAPATGK